MPVIKKLTTLLEKNNIDFKEVEHKKVYTALDKAETEHRKPQEISKTLVIMIDKKPAFVVIPANKNLDKTKLKKFINNERKKYNTTVEKKSEKHKSAKKIDFAKEAWMKKNIQGNVGATPPFGSLWKMPTYIDTSLLKKKNILICTGDYTISYEISSKAFKIVEPNLTNGNFSKAK